MFKLETRLVNRLLNAILSKRYLQAILIGLVIGVSLLASADGSISGRVVSVVDGDTLTVLDVEYQQHKIRLAGIDAPEKAMPFGQGSKQKLVEFCFGKQAQVNVIDIDRYGRSVGEVLCDGIYANAEMVKSGYAWVYRSYDKGFKSFYALERTAKGAGLGLWADVDPVPPWQWRHYHRLQD